MSRLQDLERLKQRFFMTTEEYQKRKEEQAEAKLLEKMQMKSDLMSKILRETNSAQYAKQNSRRSTKQLEALQKELEQSED
jgi:hypothetical protein